MVALLVLVFLGVFALLSLILLGSGGNAVRTKQTLAVLQSALGVEASRSGDPMVDIRKSELLSAVPWVNRWLQTIGLAPRLRVLLSQANVKWTAGRLLLLSAACFVVPTYVVYLRSGNLVIAGPIGLVAAGAPLFYVLHKRSQRFNRFEEGLPEAMDLMVNAMRAGNSLVAALSLVARESADPVGAEFRICFEEQNYGLDLRTAMDHLLIRIPLQDLRIVVTAILIQKESGGNLAEVLDKTAYLIRERYRLKRQVRVHSAQGRMTGWILSVLPIVLGVALYLVNPDAMSLLWMRPIGVKLLYASAGLTVVGALIIRKIVDVDV